MSYKINGDGLVHVITKLTGIKFCTGILKIRSWRTLQWDTVFFFSLKLDMNLNCVCISDCFCNVLTTAVLFNSVYPKFWEPSVKTYAFNGVTLQQWIVSNGL